LVETEASAISPGTELAVYTGVHQWLNDPTRTWPRFPFVPGYSAVGHVAALGEGVEGFAVGDRLVWPGRHESHALLKPADSRTAIWRIAASVPAPVAALALITRFPLTALVRAEQMLGQSVAVMGLGTIGQITLRLFSAAGAYPLIGVDPQGGRRVVAERTPGVATIDPSDGDLKQKLRAVNGGALPDIVVDATGVPNVVRAAMSSVVDGGKVIMVGSPRGIAGEVDFYWDLHGRSISLIGAHGSAIGDEPREKFPFVRDRALRTIVHFLESGKLKIDDLITHHVHGAEAKPMYDGLLNQRDDFLAVTLHW
jgi:2-desacetyl-2-hydroxyethyl bacteriochlorophyllide A dehydrogenase